MSTVLVVDDDESIRGIIEEVLSDDGHAVETACSAEDALTRIDEGGIALVLSDIRMGGMSGIKMLKEIRKRDGNISVIIMTSYATVDNTIEALKAGACDYLRKPFDNLAQITSIVNKALESAAQARESEHMIATLTRRNSELSRLNTNFRDMAIKDGLTNLYNHRYFQESLAAEIELARRADLALSVLFIDVDHFKAYNDEYGHLRGDDVLKQVARLLEANTRDRDVVARWGGEEFVVLAAETTRADANTLAEKIRTAVGSFPFYGCESQPDGHITISVGVASLVTDDSFETLVGRADQAVYEAKATGRNRVCLQA